MIRFRRSRLRLRILLSRLTSQPRDVVLRHEFNLWAENGAGEGMKNAHMPITERALAKMDFCSTDRILDLGCGQGWTIALLAARAGKRARIVGIDISDGMLRRAQAKGGSAANSRFVCGSAEYIPCKDSFFTKILSIEAFYYFDHQDQVLKELLRVTAPFGRLFLLICFYKDHPDSLGTASDVSMPVYARSVAEYKRMLLQAGWSEVEMEEFVREPEAGRAPDVHDRALFITAQKR